MKDSFPVVRAGKESFTVVRAGKGAFTAFPWAKMGTGRAWPPGEETAMKLSEVATALRDLLSAKRVYGEPVERDGVVVIPAAEVYGGGGGGVDEGIELKVRQGIGFGGVARPVGAFVIRDGEVTWKPAFDATWLGFIAAVTVVSLAKVLVRVHKDS